MKLTTLTLSLLCLAQVALADPSAWDPTTAKNQASMKELFTTQVEALNEFSAENSASKSWNLSTIMVDYGITHKGMLGLLPFKGTAAATAFWQLPKAESQSEVQKVEPKADLKLSTKMSFADVIAQGDYFVDVITKTQKIKDSKKLKAEMRTLLEEFYTVAHALAGQHHPGWRPTRLYFDRSITVDGMIIRRFLGGVLVRFRVAWDLSSPNKIGVPAEIAEKSQKLIPNLEQLVTSLADDLHVAASQLPVDELTYVKSFSIGLGMTKEFDLVGIVEASDSAMGIIDFDYFPGEAAAPVSKKMAHTTIKFIDSDDEWQDIDRDNLRKGLAQAFKMASVFFKIGSEIPSPIWKLGRIDVSFAMSEDGEGWISRVNSDATSVISFGRR